MFYRTLFYVNQYIRIVVNTLFSWSVCIYMYIYYATPTGPCLPLPSLRNSVHNATSWREVKANLVSHLTIISKICLVSVTYLSSTTVMESVATLKCVRIADISHQRCVTVPMHISTTTPHLRWSCAYIMAWSHKPCIALPMVNPTVQRWTLHI